MKRGRQLKPRWIAVGCAFGAVLAWGVHVLQWSSPPLHGVTPDSLPQGAKLDSFGRLLDWPAKPVVECPGASPTRWVLLTLGQSNAANHASRRTAAIGGRAVYNYANGRCYEAASPLLGATGTGGEPWSALGHQLVDRGHASSVVLIPVAVAGSAIAMWAPGGVLHPMLLAELAALPGQLRPTHVLWVQGEADFALGTSADAYRAGFFRLLKSLRDAGVAAPVYAAVSTRCVVQAPWSAANPVAMALAALPDSRLGLLPGPNLDEILSASDRFDGCHLSAEGTAKASRAWAHTLANDSPVTPASTLGTPAR